MISETLKKQIQEEYGEFQAIYRVIGNYDEEGSEFTDIKHDTVQALMNWHAEFDDVGTWDEIVIEFLTGFMDAIQLLREQGFRPDEDDDESEDGKPTVFTTPELGAVFSASELEALFRKDAGEPSS